jgi:hypothetical protein
VDDDLTAAEENLRRTDDPKFAAMALVLAERAGRASHVALRWALTIDRWRDLDSPTQESAARNVESLLDGSCRFVGICSHSLGQTTNNIAHFRWRNHPLVLIPAGNVRLGVDRQGLKPSEELLAWISSWCVRNGHPSGTQAAQDHFHDAAQDLQPLRETFLPPFLIETDASAWPGWAFLGARVDEHGFLHSELEELKTCLRDFAVDGLRLPTTDEWEFACSGGSRELFRWGGQHPLDQLPWEDRPWRLHRERNAFGLALPSDTNAVEICPPWNLRGGDAGIGAHGQLRLGGAMLTWLSLASSFDGTRMVEEVAGLSIDECNPSFRLVRPLRLRQE